MNAAAHVACSLDVDENFALLPFQRQSLPEVPPRAPRPPTPAATSPKPIRPPGGGGTRPRLPLAQQDVNALTLAREISSLENRNAVLERQLAVHVKLVAGFAALYSTGR
jgi:hypothetical protein